MALVSKTFSEIITFTRASTASYFNSAGALTSAAINAPRLDYNPSTLAAQGLLIEEQRTNSIRNSTGVGAVAGTPGTLPINWVALGAGLGTLTQQIVGTGTSAGITYIDVKISGTTSTTSFGIQFESYNQISAATGQNWTSSIYVALIAGATTNLTINHRVQERTTLGVSLANTTVDITASLTSSLLNRFTNPRVFNQATTAFSTNDITLFFSSGVAIDITLRIGLPQLELGAFATSVIPTTTAAVTRSADVALVNTLSPWFNATEGTLFMQGIIAGGTAATFPRMSTLAGSNPNNDDMGVVWGANAGSMRWTVRSGGATQADVSFSLPKSAGASFKVAGRYAANDFQAAFDGNLGVPDTTGTLPTITSLSLGGPASFQPGANVWLQRVTFYPRGLTNAELQTITT